MRHILEIPDEVAAPMLNGLRYFSACDPGIDAATHVRQRLPARQSSGRLRRPFRPERQA
jgi:hypothetical protein